MLELVGVVDDDRRRRRRRAPRAARARTSRCRAGDLLGVDAGAQRDRAARRRRRRRRRCPPRRGRAGPRCTGTPSWRRRGARRRACAANASRNSRARARRSSSATMYAGVPNSRASSTRSQPPTSMRPAAFSVVPSGHTWDRLWAVAIARRGCHVGVGGLAASRELRTDLDSVRRIHGRPRRPLHHAVHAARAARRGAARRRGRPVRRVDRPAAAGVLHPRGGDGDVPRPRRRGPRPASPRRSRRSARRSSTRPGWRGCCATGACGPTRRPGCCSSRRSRSARSSRVTSSRPAPASTACCSARCSG